MREVGVPWLSQYVPPRLMEIKGKAPKSLDFRAFLVVAAVGFEPTTLRV